MGPLGRGRGLGEGEEIWDHLGVASHDKFRRMLPGLPPWPGEQMKPGA